VRGDTNNGALHALVLERSWRCQQRLYRRWSRMGARGKLPQKTVVACARENPRTHAKLEPHELIQVLVDY